MQVIGIMTMVYEKGLGIFMEGETVHGDIYKGILEVLSRFGYVSPGTGSLSLSLSRGQGAGCNASHQVQAAAVAEPRREGQGPARAAQADERARHRPARKRARGEEGGARARGNRYTCSRVFSCVHVFVWVSMIRRGLTREGNDLWWMEE